MRWRVTNVIHRWIDYKATSLGDTNRNIFHLWLRPFDKIIVVVVGESRDVLPRFLCPLI
jgi:hypothetical protein